MLSTNRWRPAPPQAVDPGIYGQSPLRLSTLEKITAPFFYAALVAWFFLCAAFLRSLGASTDMAAAIPGVGFGAGAIAWTMLVHNKPPETKAKIARATLISLAAVSVVCAVSFGMAMMMSSRYVTHTVDGQIFVVDRLWGDVRLCDNLGCSALNDITVPATTGATN